MSEMARDARGPAWLPPKPVIHAAWKAHRRVYGLTHGRRGLRPQTSTRWGTMHVTTSGRRTGQPRAVILAFITDGPNLITMAMNGWDAAEPAWWLNLQHDARASVVLPDGSTREVTGRAATTAEHDRLWEQYRQVTPHLDDYAARRGTPTTLGSRAELVACQRSRCR